MDIKGINISGTNVSSIPKDTYFQNVSALLHFNNSLTDTSPRSKTFTASAGYSAVFFKFGTHSYSSGGDLRVPDISPGTEFSFADADLTIEGWFYLVSTGDNQPLFSTTGGNSSADPRSYMVATSGGFWQILANQSGGASWNITYTTTSSVVANIWTHLAFVRRGTTLEFFKDGVSGGTTTIIGGVTNGDSFNSGAGGPFFAIGGKSTQFNGPMPVYNTSLSGYIDEFRVTKGVGRYSSNFTPPTEPFPDR